MMQKPIALKNSFNDVVRLDPKTFAYFAVWEQGHHINFWNDKGGNCVGDLRFSPDTFDDEAEQIFLRLQSEGMTFIRLDGGIDPDTGRDSGYRFYYRPEAIEYFEDDISRDALGSPKTPCLSIAGVPFYLGEDEKADFKHRLFSLTPSDDWLELSKDIKTAFRCASGHYAFRKSMVTDMFANAREGLLAIQTHDRYRSFVPVKQPEKIIGAVAQALPHLVRSDAPAPALPLYYDPAVYPPGKRHHVNIILRR